MTLQARDQASPVVFLFLVLPMGISVGYSSVTLPFILTRSGYSVAAAAAVVAVGLSANLWRFLWGPLADLTLTLRRWYILAVIACAATLLILNFMPLDRRAIAAVSAVVFVSQIASTLVLLPVGGLMAHAVADEQKGRAGGWFQAGNLGGSGLGGGAGVWLVTHASLHAAGVTLAAAMLVCAASIYFVPDIRVQHDNRVKERILEIGKDFRELLRTPIVLYTTVLICTPIGAASAANLWSSIAPEWHASPDTVALTTGVFSGLASVIGCVAAGHMADRAGKWWAFFTAGTAMAVVALVMAEGPRTPFSYSTGVLAYAITFGMANAAFSAVVLAAIGRGAAATKYALMSSIGNVPCVYMTAFDGWAYDRWRGAGMLNAEGSISVVAVILALAVLSKVIVRMPAAALRDLQAPN